jgi:2-dehydro-3-deoxygalactonokinase
VIAIDWGTSSFRAYRVAAEGAVLERRSAPLGILQVESGRFAQALESQIEDWLSAGERPVVMCGMIGSRQGWKEAPYVACPAGPEDIAQHLVQVPWGARRSAWLAPGLSSRDADNVPDVMRGEETQILGVLDQLPHAAWICLPGTHSKWVEIRGGKIARFRTHMTGEVFAVLKAHSILGRMMMPDAALDAQWFEAGVQRARAAGGLLHHLFGVRARGLFGELPDAGASSYLSGILIGHELLSIPGSAQGAVYLLGSPELEQLYRRALEQLGRPSVSLDPDAAVRGLIRLARGLPRG